MPPLEPPEFSEIDTWFVAQELKQTALGQRFHEGYRLGEAGCIFQLGTTYWFVSIDPRLYRFHRVEEVSGAVTPIPELDHLKGSVLQRVETPKGERMILLEFKGQTPLRELQVSLLILELMGKYSNVILINSERKIEWSLKRVTPAMSRVRPVEPGRFYTPPPRKRWSLMDPERFPAPEDLRKHFPFVPPDEPDPVRWLQTYLKKAQSNPKPVVVVQENRRFVLPAPVEHVEVLRSFSTYSEAVAFAYQPSPEEETEPPSIPPGIQKEWERVQAYEKYRFLAEEVMRRREELVSTGILKTEWQGEPILVELGPQETPEDLARRYAREAARLERGYRKLQKLLQQRQTREPSCVSAPSSGPVKDAPPQPRYWTFTSPSGFKVLVGKNARGNDEITFRLAARDDFFFHVKDAPGAHVILKTGKAEPKEEDLLFAAKKALEHSAKASDGKGVVSYTRVRYLRKPKGAPPGLVLLLKEETLNVRL